MLRITKEYGKNELRLDYLNDPHLGPDSALAKGEWELWRFRIQLLEDASKWEELFDISGKLLQRARAKDSKGNIAEPGMADWIVWTAFLRSAMKVSGHE